MSRTEQMTAEDIALVRRANANRASAKKKPTATASKSTSRQESREAKQASPASEGPDPDDRLRQVVAVLLALGAILTLLALVSYSRFDQANTDIGISELGGLVTNDPDIAGRAQATQNWLGLVGAFVADTLLNGTIGWFALVVPLLLGYWSFVIFTGRDTTRPWRQTGLVILLGVLLATAFGTVRATSFGLSLPFEWSGAVGAFLASMLSGLTGITGASLIVTAALLVAAIYTFEIDLRLVGAAIGPRLAAAIDTVRRGASSLRSEVAARGSRLWDLSASDRGREHGEAPDGLTGDATPSSGPADDEPARMIRRVTEHRTDAQSASDSDIPAHVAERIESARTEADRTAAAKKPPTTNDRQPVAGTETPTPDVEARSDEVAGTGNQGIRLSRTPVEEPEESAALPKLTVHVEEAETDADLETDETGHLIERLKDEKIKYDPPGISLLAPQESHEEVEDEELKANAQILQEKLRTFNIEIEDLTVTPGPVVTLFEFVPAAGIKLSQIESLTDDIALALKARGIRIIAPIPGKGTVGVEIPNNQPALVRIRSVLNTTKFRESDLLLPLALGKTTVGEVFCADLARMPHLLIAGATGAGKSVGINSILASLLYKKHPSELKLAIIDPKKIELTQYRNLINHYLVKCPDVDEDIVTDPQNAVTLLKSLELEMDRRYDLLAKSGQRNIVDYNRKIEEGVLKPTEDAPHTKMPFLVLIIDELADLMITAAKEVEEPIARLAQLARAIGIHMIVATQRPSVDVLTGMIKANFPARIAYQVASKTDSRTILDMNGAEQLLGNGDLLYLPGGRPKPYRLQNAFITTEEVEAMCDHVGTQKGYSTPYELPSVAEKKKQAAVSSIDERDELFDEAARIIVRHQQGSVSLLQRRLKVGYARAARIVDELEDAGIVGPFDGSKARQVMLESEAELEAFL